MSAEGSKPVLTKRKLDFRNTPESRHSKCSLACPKSANSRHALALMFAVMLTPYTASALVREAEH
jgi:hypothetical protein